MDTTRAIEVFTAFPDEGKREFLARVAHALTILARDSYEVGQDGLTNPVRVRTINEIEHRVTSHLLTLLTHESARYPDDVLVRIILEHPQDPVLQQQLHSVWATLLSQVAAAA